MRYYLLKGTPLKEAANLAVDECIRQGKLADILSKNRSEVIDMILTTYNKKQHMKTIREEALEDGHAVGREQGREELLHLITAMTEDGRVMDIPKLSKDPDFLAEMLETYHIKNRMD